MADPWDTVLRHLKSIVHQMDPGLLMDDLVAEGLIGREQWKRLSLPSKVSEDQTGRILYLSKNLGENERSRTPSTILSEMTCSK